VDLSSISKKRRRRQHVAFVTLENKENSRGGVENAHRERERQSTKCKQTNYYRGGLLRPQLWSFYSQFQFERCICQCLVAVGFLMFVGGVVK